MTAIIFLFSEKEFDKVETLKKSIIEYLGLRIVACDCDDYPVIITSYDLNPSDKSVINDKVQGVNSDGGTVLFLEGIKEDFFKNYTKTCKVI